MSLDTQQHQTTEKQNKSFLTFAPRTYGAYWLILLIAIGLVAMLHDQVIWVNGKRGWYTQPAIAPAAGLGILLCFTLIRLLVSFKVSSLKLFDPVEALFEGLGNYRTALFSSFLFFIYIQSLSVMGFVIATVIFVTTLLWISRLLNWFWFSCTLGTVFILVLIFRVAISFWLPDVWLYSLLPDEWADFANQYL